MEIVEIAMHANPIVLRTGNRLTQLRGLATGSLTLRKDLCESSTASAGNNGARRDRVSSLSTHCESSEGSSQTLLDGL